MNNIHENGLRIVSVGDNLIAVDFGIGVDSFTPPHPSFLSRRYGSGWALTPIKGILPPPLNDTFGHLEDAIEAIQSYHRAVCQGKVWSY